MDVAIDCGTSLPKPSFTGGKVEMTSSAGKTIPLEGGHLG